MTRDARIGTIIAGLLCAAGLATAPGAFAQGSVERGAYLVNAVMACDTCHTPRGPNGGLDMTRRLSGGSQIFETPAYLVKGANITPDRETGIGAWSDADLKRTLTTGVRPDGSRLATAMPFAFYGGMTPGDLDSIVAFLRSLPPVNNKVQAPVYRLNTVVHAVPGTERPTDERDLADPVKRGAYLATLAHCQECHAGHVGDTPDFRGAPGKGGRVFSGPAGSVAAVNITSSKTAGIGDWTDEDIKRVLTTSKGRDGLQLAGPMARGAYFKNMTPGDMDALIAYLRRLPPLD